MMTCKRSEVNFNKAIRLSIVFAVMEMFVACGGDNGSSGPEHVSEYIESAESERSSSSILSECDSINCGERSSSSSKKVQFSSGEEYRVSSSSSDKAQSKVDAVSQKSISGVAQKGPFVSRSTIKLYELDCETFAQTGKYFTGKIVNDDGKFSVSGVTLSNPYALFEVSGYFLDEFSGEMSRDSVTLYALTDLRNRSNVNINLLTHLEYKRVIHLIKSGLDFASAKKKAKTEILKAFGINGEFANSEDLDLFGKDEGSAALLAISILMRGNYGKAEQLSLRLANFIADFTETGFWNDENVKTQIADWANWADWSDLAYIRRYVERWNLGFVPEFEKYVRNFWYENYGLGECNLSNEAEVLAVKNEYSVCYGTASRFICKDGAWVEASDIEKDTYKWKAGEDGEVKSGNMTKTKYVYDGKMKKWREATSIEIALGGCTESREKDFDKNTGKMDGLWYICRNQTWNPIDDVTVDTLGWTKGNDGDLQKGNKSNVIYKFDEAQNKWLVASSKDVKLELGCTTNRTGEVGKSTEYPYYYVCRNLDWQMAQEIEYDTYGETCSSTEIGKMIDGVETATNKYYCTATGWLSMMEWSWILPKDVRFNSEITYGTMTDSRDKKVYKTVEIGEQVWMAENLNYADSLKTPSLLRRSWCFDDKKAYCVEAGRLYTWAAAIDSVKLANDVNNPQICGYGERCIYPKKVQGLCPNGWHLPSGTEWVKLYNEIKSYGERVLRSQTGWGEDNGTDAFGFSLLPVGYKFGSYYFDGGARTCLWVTVDDADSRINALATFDGNVGSAQSVSKNLYGCSIRCLKDSD